MRVFLALFLLITVGCGRQVIEAGGSSLPVSSSLNAEHVAIQTDLKMNFVSFLASCEMFPDSKKICEANLKELRSVTYTDEFKKDDGTKDNNTVGRCTVYDNVMRYVQFLKSYVKEIGLFSPTFIGLMYHEGHHCLTDQGHAPENSLRIMAPALLQPTYYLNHLDALVKDSFEHPVPSNEGLHLEQTMNDYGNEPRIVYQQNTTRSKCQESLKKSVQSTY